MGFAQSLDSIVWSVVGTDAVVGAGVLVPVWLSVQVVESF